MLAIFRFYWRSRAALGAAVCDFGFLLAVLARSWGRGVWPLEIMLAVWGRSGAYAGGLGLPHGLMLVV